MSKLYVFGIGGTGARVLRSLTHLLACGVACRDTVVPVLIDPDVSNGDLSRTVTLMQHYASVRGSLSFGNDTSSRFFATELMEIGHFRLPVQDTQDLVFKDFMAVDQGMSRPSQALLHMLFSERNMQADMSVGFKGNPNMGIIVLNQFATTPEFIDLANIFQQDDRVFIVSSIFGGTGASGFPLLLNTLRDNHTLPNFGLLNEAVVGAVSVLPYFKVKATESSSIESDAFIAKTRSALAYYDKNLQGKLQAMYYIGDNATAHRSYPNIEGGREQRNNAHLVELLAALAVLDFANHDFQPHGKTVYKEFGMEVDKEQTVIFGNFAATTRNILRRPLTQAMLMANYMDNVGLDLRLAQQWSRDNGLGATFFAGDFFGHLQACLKDYVAWLHEMEDNQLSFAPFERNAQDAFAIVRGVTPARSFLGKKNYQLFDATLDDVSRSFKKRPSPERAFMELFSAATAKLVAQKLKY